MEKFDAQKYVNQNDDSKSIIDEILSDDEVMEKLTSLGVSKEEVKRYALTIYRYKVSKDQCKNCKGLDSCTSDSYHNSTGITIGDAGEVINTFGPCEKQAALDTISDNYLDRCFPDEWATITKPNSSARVTKVLRVLQKALKSKDKKWVYLCGNTGTGKSYILATFCNVLASKGAKVSFIDANQKFGELRSMSMDKYNKAKFDAEMTKLQTIRVLVIDNFGSEFKSEYVINTVLRPIISERAKNRLYTFFTSNYSLNDISTLYSSTQQAKLEISTIISVIKNNIESETAVEDGIENYLFK